MDISVTLKFKSEDDKKDFMAGLCDGWGEGYCRLKWPWKDGVKFTDCNEFEVDVLDDY